MFVQRVLKLYGTVLFPLEKGLVTSLGWSSYLYRAGIERIFRIIYTCTGYRMYIVLPFGPTFKPYTCIISLQICHSWW